MDLEFIAKAEKVASLNLSAADFQTLQHKKEIQYLFGKNFFPKFDLKKTIKSIDVVKINALIKELKSIDNGLFQKLHSYNLKGIGPGETTLFFLVDTAHLGGGSSAGVDLVAGSKKYEIKTVKVSKDRFVSDFKLGGTVPLSEIMTDLNTLREQMKLGGSKTEMSGAIIAEMVSKNPAAYAEIEKSFRAKAYEYFKNHEVIFINNGSNLGNIEAVAYIDADQIFIERVTSGTVKPKIKL